MKDNLCQDYGPLLVKITATGETLSITTCRIGSFRSNWRLRDVDIYEHPTDTDKVVTVAKGFSGGTNCNTVEPRTNFRQEIGKFGIVYS